MMERKSTVGHQTTRSQQLLLVGLIERRWPTETIIIHHITDTYQKLQLEIERRAANGITFERIIL